MSYLTRPSLLPSLPPALGVTVQLQSGQRLSLQVSPLQTLSGLYESLPSVEADEAIVSLEFGNISEEKIDGEGGSEGGSEGGRGGHISF